MVFRSSGGKEKILTKDWKEKGESRSRCHGRPQKEKEIGKRSFEYRRKSS